MSIGLITGATNMRALEDWQAMCAHNLANSSTAGYQASSFEVRANKIQGSGRTPDVNRAESFLLTGQLNRTLGMGQVKITGNPYDLSIAGEGFFSVQNQNGQVLYTRDGEFHRNQDGILVNKLGFPVLANGSPIELPPAEGPVTVTTDGTVSQNGQTVSKISVFKFTNPDMMNKGNGSYFLDTDDSGGVIPVEMPSIRQGQIEMSTVQPLKEMVSMIEISRAYELTQKLIEEDVDRVDAVIQTFSV